VYLSVLMERKSIRHSMMIKVLNFDNNYTNTLLNVLSHYRKVDDIDSHYPMYGGLSHTDAGTVAFHP
jgi:hypothetical protein